jgi:hypothetical protein
VAEKLRGSVIRLETLQTLVLALPWLDEGRLSSHGELHESLRRHPKRIPALVERPILKRRTGKGAAAHGDRADLSSLLFEALHRAYGAPKEVRVAIEHLM